MADPSEPLVLGYDNQRQCWSEGDITAKVRSMTEPDRAVPLTARLEVVPDILDCAVDYAEKDTFRAHVSLKPGVTLPADDQARVTIIADPVMEMGLQIMSAVGGMPLQGLFKNLRAHVKVQLVPYCLRIQGSEDGREFEVSQQVGLEADGKTRLVLEAAVYKVDSGGAPAATPTSLAVSASSALEGVKLESAPIDGGGGVRVTLLCEKPLLGESKSAGSLTFTATLPGGRQIQRKLSVQLNPVSAELEVTPQPRFRINSAPPQLLLTVKNSRGKAVAGLATRWELAPAVGGLSSLTGTTDAAGQVRVSYTPPALEAALAAFTAETLPVAVKVTSGAEAKVIATRELTLEFFALLPVTVEKAGFATVSRQLELTKPGGATVFVNTAAGNKSPVAHARVSSNKQQVVTDSRGAASLSVGQSGGGSSLEVSLELDQQSQDLTRMLNQGLADLQAATWSTAFVGGSCQKLDNFLRFDYVARLAEEEESEYPNSVLNLKALYQVLRVGQHSMSLFERRFGRFREQLSSAMGNLAGAFFTWLGEKYFPRMGAWLGNRVKRLLSYLAGKISGRPWLLARARGAVGTVRGWINRLGEKLQKLKRKVGPGRNRLPEAMDQKLNQNFDMPVRPGVITPGDEAVRAAKEAAEKAADARKLHLNTGQAFQALESQERELRNQLAAALSAPPPLNSAEIARLRGEISEVSSRAAQAGLAAREASQALEAAETAEKAAASSLEDLRNTCAALDELLAAFMQALSRLYEYGAWLLAYLILGIGSALLANMRKVSGGVHAGAPQALDSAVEDLVTKQAFTVAFELGGYYVVGPAIYSGLMIYQGYSLAVALEEAQALSSRWPKLEPETMKAALRWWYEDIDAASFKTEETEVWLELSADLADWLEWLLVWITRLVNLLLGVVGAVVSLLTLGATVPAWLMVSAGFTAFIEGMDRFWDIIKAVGRSGTAIMGAAEVWGVVLPAHGSFTAKLYGDPSLASRLDRAWTYPVDNDLRDKLKHLREKPGSFPGEAALEGINNKLNELGAQLTGQEGG